MKTRRAPVQPGAVPEAASADLDRRRLGADARAGEGDRRRLGAADARSAGDRRRASRGDRLARVDDRSSACRGSSSARRETRSWPRRRRRTRSSSGTATSAAAELRGLSRVRGDRHARRVPRQDRRARGGRGPLPPRLVRERRAGARSARCSCPTRLETTRAGSTAGPRTSRAVRRQTTPIQVETTLFGVFRKIWPSDEKLPQLFQTPPPVTDALLPVTFAPGWRREARDAVVLLVRDAAAVPGLVRVDDVRAVRRRRLGDRHQRRPGLVAAVDAGRVVDGAAVAVPGLVSLERRPRRQEARRVLALGRSWRSRRRRRPNALLNDTVVPCRATGESPSSDAL